jgi:LuxR family maltose regulon positive regulatory protein
VTAIRCAIACFQNDLRRAESYAERALRDLPEEDLGFRPLIYGALGDSYRRIGRWEEARSWYLKATRFTDAPTFRVESAHVFGALADLDLRQGRLHRAAGYWRKALAAVEDPENWGRLPLPVFGWVKLRLGELLYEWNDLDQAWDHLARGLELAEVGGDVQSLIAGYVISARLKLTRDDFDGAAELLAKAQPLVDGAAFPDWTSRFERCQIELWLTQGKLRLAVDWVDTALRDGTLEERSESESVRLATARVLIVKGDAPSRDRAVSLLDDLLQAAETHGRMGVQIEALALQAIAHWGRGDTARAMTFLERSLRLAEPEGYVRLFADLGLPMTRLLQEARSREVRPNYVSRLLAACGVALTPPGNGKAVLPEPLSQREQDVLGLIAAGLTNREIAESLFISPETVKKHTSSIFGKLGVGSRTQAVARARSLGFLDER